MQTDPAVGLRSAPGTDVLHRLCHAFGSLRSLEEAEAALTFWLTEACVGGIVHLHVFSDGEAELSDGGAPMTEARRTRLEQSILTKKAGLREVDIASGRAVGTFPLVSRGDVFGVVDVEASHGRLSQARPLIESIVSQGAILLRNLRLQRELERELSVMRDLRDIEVRMASIAHELKGPIVTVRHLLAQALEVGVSSGSRHALLQESKDELHKLDHVIDSLLVSRHDLSSAETFDLLGLALEAIEDNKAEADEYFLSLHGEPVEVDASRTRLRIAVSNVIRNALRHSPAGSEVMVTVSSDASLARIKVEDKGPGVDPEDMPTIFDAFARGGEPSVDGSGLGLFITRTVLESHGGSVQATQRPEGGACFTLELPRRSAEIGLQHAL